MTEDTKCQDERAAARQKFLLLLCGVKKPARSSQAMNDEFRWRGRDPQAVSSRQLMLWDLFVFPDVTNLLVLQENNLHNEAVAAINDDVYRHS